MSTPATPQHSATPGADLVRRELGLSTDELDSLHPGGTAHGELARQTAAAAERLDELVEHFRNRADWAATDLARYAQGHREVRSLASGILQLRGVEIDILAARISDQHTRVESLCRSCKRAGTVPSSGQAAQHEPQARATDLWPAAPATTRQPSRAPRRR
ncbi:hypothetical protein [Streptacidiphilus jiangxiensis]|uniref:Uncharacterized protein n=1 Tax=Streptacidiphilus jiangxiensis TaxID=235985 RepID=A0A1H8A6C9_STRJI|nr:hypothetical protein [Streptacidiphilus jiangxiensis]SEM66260.1 hypothetical protein SAMN05414137_14142 [Streptacidiphilus jiangxiensis]